MGFTDRIIELNRRHAGALRARREAAWRQGHGLAVSADALLELSSIDQTVDFFEDRLEFRSRLGSAHGVIPYSRVRAVRILGRAVAPRISTKTNTYDIVLATPSKMSLTLDSAHRPVTFDFRSESPERVDEALAVVRRYLQVHRPATNEAHATTSATGPSRADELTKMSELHRRGVLSDEEFEREKARILGA
ncbi:MAG: SHOCT domain-containing protein [Acidimicrobiales bacterium]|jgi:hypothetical protein